MLGSLNLLCALQGQIHNTASVTKSYDTSYPVPWVMRASCQVLCYLAPFIATALTEPRNCAPVSEIPTCDAQSLIVIEA